MATRRDKLDATMAELATMSPAQLREEWANATNKPLPRLSSAMLRLALGYEMQCKSYGGLSRPTRQGSISSLPPRPRRAARFLGCGWFASATADGQAPYLIRTPSLIPAPRSGEPFDSLAAP